MISIISGVISNLLARLILKSLRLLKLGAPYVDLEFVPTALGLEETPVRLPQLGNGNLTIRGRVHELKQGMELPFFLPNGTTGLVILGWGVLIGPERFHGSLVDFGKIGELRFYGRDDKHVNTIDISLPHGAKPLDLKLADANPIMSGKPSETLVGQAGFLARVEVRQNPTAREFWDHVNVWISEVEVPSGAQRAVFNAINGSMNIVHLRALRRPRLLRVIEKFRRESVAEAIPDDPNVWAKEAELLRHSVSSFEKMADARDEGTCMEAVSSYVNAAWGNVKLAYFPGRESSKAAHLQSSALQFECAADAAKQVGENLLAAKYYVHALLAVEQAGSRREDSLVEKATAAPMELESQQRDREPLNMDMLYRVWYHLGLINLESARTHESRRVEFFLKACDYYVDKIVRAVLERNLPSFHELRFAQERLHILRSEYYKLSVVADEMLSKVLEELKTVDSELAKREATS